MTRPARTLNVVGVIEDGDVAGLRVEVWDVDRQHRAPLGSATTDRRGEFQIDLDEAQVEEIFHRREVELYFVVWRGEQRLGDTLWQIRWRREHAGHKRRIVVKAKTPPSPPTTRAATVPSTEAHQVTGQVLDEKSGAALVGVTVRAVDVASAVPLGTTKTDALGRFQVSLAVKAGNVPSLRIEVLAPDGSHLQDAAPPAKEGDPVVVRAPVPAPPAAPSPAIANVVEAAGLQLSAAVIKALADRNIRTLGDVRAAGGLPDLAADPTARALAAHAALSTIQPDVKINAQLIQRGFDSPVAIARSARADFVTKMRDAAGNFGAMKTYALAHVQTNCLNQSIFGMAAEAANGRPVPQEFAATLGQNGFTSPSCTCEDCEAAVGPAAYLADLLEYCTDHLAVKGVLVTLPQLTDLFLQPFGDLIPSCTEVQRRVRQVRICIEVLRRALTSAGITQPVASESDYRFAAYRALLVQIGTNIDEVRAARTAPTTTRTSLAARLGLSLTTPRPTAGDELDSLRLMPGLATHVLDEASLEVVFGLQDTTRDPLSTGIKDGDPQGQIAHFSLQAAEYAVSTDPDGLVYVNVYRTNAPTTYHVDLYRDAPRTQLVAQGTATDANGTVIAFGRNGAAIEGRFRLAYTADSNTIALRALPRLVAWRSREARRIWQIEDRPFDLFVNMDPAADPSDRLPVVDPDLIGPDDFRLPFEKANSTDPDGPFDLWRRRRDWVDGQIATIRSLRAQTAPYWPRLFAAAQQSATYGTTTVQAWPASLADSNLDSVANDLNDPARSDAAKDTIAHPLHLSLDGFSRLLAIRAKDKIGQALQDSDWSDAVSILVQAQKAALFPAWITEENAIVELGPEHFWVSQRQPKPGDWPPAPTASPTPVIDTALKLDELAEDVAGRRAIALWNARQVELAALVAALRTAHESSTAGQAFETMFTLALGPAPAGVTDWSTFLNTIYTNFTDGVNGALAQQALDNVLHMGGEALTRLMAIKSRYDDTSPQAVPPSPSEWAEVYTVLADAQKIAARYAAWIQEEVALGFQTIVGGVPMPVYWRALKAKLPPWRGPVDVRAEWDRALVAWGAPPVVDPDLITAGHLRNPAAGDPAFTPFSARLTALAAQKAALDSIRTAAAAQVDGFDNMVVAALLGEWPSGTTFVDRVRAQIAADRGAKGIPFAISQVFGPAHVDFAQLNTDLGDPAKHDAATHTIVEQLFLTVASFARVVAIINEAAPPAVDLTELDARLAQAVAVGRVMALAIAEDGGDDITPRLDQLGLSAEAFDALRGHRLLALDDAIDVSEWGPIEDILVAARKRRRFATWRREEASAHLTISPDWFQEPVPDPTVFPPVPLPAPATWRATASDRSDWEDTLQARIDTQQTIVDAIAETVSDTEEQTLPQLRDGLISALGLQPRDVAKRYFIDGEVGGCQITTRIAQAIVSVQGILFGARIGQPPASITLQADQFDDEWKWIGSYGTWRAVMFIVEYPDNLLVPSLRRWQTPAFRQLAQKLSSGRNITPELACEAAKTYADYFADVLNMSMDASCQTVARVHQPERCRDRNNPIIDAFVVFQFGRGPVTGQAYWLLYDPAQNPDHAIGFWTVIPGFEDVEVVKVLGAVAYMVPVEQRRYLFVFVQTIDKGNQKVSFIRYDLEKAIWDQQPTDLDLPDKTVNWMAVVKQTASETTPPHVGFWLDGGRILDRRLNEDGSGWEKSDFRLMVDPSELRDAEGLLAMVEYDEQSFYIFIKGADTKIYTKLLHLFDVPVFRLVKGADIIVSNDFLRFLSVPPWWFSQGGSHFFTTDPNQRDTMIGKGYTYQGVAFRVGALPRAGSSALYRLVQRPHGDSNNSISSYLVRGKGNRDGAISNWPQAYQDDGILGYVYDSQVTGTTVLYRVYDAKDDLHLATTSAAEHQQLTQTPAPTAPTAVTDFIWTDNPLYVDDPPDSSSGTLAYVTSPQWTTFDDGFAWLGAYSLGVGQGVILITELQHILTDWWQFSGGDAPSSQISPTPLVYASTLTRHSGAPRPDPDEPFDSELQYPGFIWSLPGFLGPFIARFRQIITEVPVDGTDADGNPITYEGFAVTVESVIDPLRASPMAVNGPLNGMDLPNPAEITERFTEVERRARKAQIQSMYAFNELLPTQTEGTKTILTYLQEAYYFVPVQLALALKARGEYVAALDWYRSVFDYTLKQEDRKIYYGFIAEEGLAPNFDRPGWLSDPLNPHLIAEGRPFAYTRFTLLSVIQCLIAFADSEFTRDTAESVPRAKALYELALSLLSDQVLDQTRPDCDQKIGDISISIGDDTWTPYWYYLKSKMLQVHDVAKVDQVAAAVRQILGGSDPPAQQLGRVNQLINGALDASPKASDMTAVVAGRTRALASVHQSLIGNAQVYAGANRMMSEASQNLVRAISTATGRSAAQVLQAGTGEFAFLADPSGSAAQAQGTSIHEVIYHSAYWPGGGQYVPAPSFSFCVPPNPVIRALSLHINLNLYKIRTCRNIAGLRRQLDPYAAPTDTTTGMPSIGAGGNLVIPGVGTLLPTPYRYSTLVERAKQLAQLSVQAEQSMLAALEKRDAEHYSLLKARQDLRVTQAQIRLQDLRIREANDSVRLAELQRDRAQISSDYYQGLLEAPNVFEQLALGFMAAAAALDLSAAAADFASPFQGAGPGLSATAASMSTFANLFMTLSSIEQRMKDWAYQKQIADQDVRIGEQSVTVANDNVRIVSQERNIAVLQSDNAQDTVDFLSNKFTNFELYDWMSGQLERVYSYFLQQATGTAKLAANQLAFERQEIPPVTIADDYWDAPTDQAGGDQQTPDRKGLTGSSRLLGDLTALDQFAFSSNRRKLQLSKTISLALLSPGEFQQFRQTGVFAFATPMQLFDRDFPGHYLRLIRRVRVSVVALIPPNQGIKATLSTVGSSRVVVGPVPFQTQLVQRPPESIALTSPRDATGVFELDPQSELLLPFEGLGVDGNWVFELTRASNFFDFESIADVLMTIEYTALDSPDLRAQVVQTLGTRVTFDRGFSFHTDFPDAWYDLNNPDQTATPMTVSFETRAADFPANLTKLKIANVALFFARADGNQHEVNVLALTFSEDSSGGVTAGGGADTVDGVISTRTGNGGSLTGILDKSPFGAWALQLPNTAAMRQQFTNEQITDILLVVSYAGHTPDWPV